LGAARSCVALKKELIGKIEAGQVALGEAKSVRIIVDEIRCLRAVRGNGATLLFLSLVIDADSEPATERINFSRRRKSMSPDDILEQSDFAYASLNGTCDPIGRLVVAMRIVSPADKEGSGSDLPNTTSDGGNRAFGLFAFMGNEAIGEAEKKNLLWSQPQLRGRLSCLLLAE
jgi:hypothetical protein